MHSVWFSTRYKASRLMGGNMATQLSSHIQGTPLLMELVNVNIC